MYMNRVHRSREDKIFDAAIYFIITVISLFMLYPIFNIASISISPYEHYLLHPMMVFPTKFDFSVFKFVFTSKFIFKGYGNTLFITIAGTAIALCMIALTAYPLSRRELRWKKLFMTYFVIVMVFNAGIIPEYIVIKALGLYDSRWALILPFIMPIYYLVLMKTFFESIPVSLTEAAKIDGASEAYVFLKIILPLSKPAIAAIGLFQAILYWNDFFRAVIMIRSQAKWPLQLLLREIIVAADARFMNAGGNLAEIDQNMVSGRAVQYASLIVVILPIICVYPFIQKYFVKGVMIGAVKG